MRKFTPLDHLITHFDQGLRTLFGYPLATPRVNPAQAYTEADLAPDEKRLSARLMRVNHAGEISAQALYQAQALTARTAQVRDKLQQSAREENDHLLWCQSRIEALGGHRSLFNPFWYVGSLTIGTLAGLAGDRWSLGFVAETERQVVKHLENHLQRLPLSDQKSRAVLEQMKQDEAYHAAVALKMGGSRLPRPVSWIMGRTAKVMTTTAFWI